MSPLCKFFFFFFFWHAPDYYITIVYIGKTGVKLVILKIVLKLYFAKLYFMIVTDMCAFAHVCVTALEYQFLCEKMSKISHFV